MIDYTEKIPNNVDLGRDRVLQRALEHWQPAYMSWWYDMGPTESHNYEVYLRTAITVEPDGWAKFGYVSMPEYRWGIFLQPRSAERQVNFGTHKGIRVAGSSGRISRDAAAGDRDAGRYGACFGGAAAHAGDVLPFVV